MSAIGHFDTTVEMRLRRALWRSGLRYRVHVRVVGVRPDIVFRRRKVAVFVDGCFWHGCPRHYSPPVGNSEFWRLKLEKNRARDRRNVLDLEAAGWKVLRFWECEVNGDLDRVVATIVAAVT